MREKYGYVRKNNKTRGIVVTLFACLICLSAIAFGVSSLGKRENKGEKETEDVVDLNNVKKSNDDALKKNEDDSDKNIEKTDDSVNNESEKKDTKDVGLEQGASSVLRNTDVSSSSQDNTVQSDNNTDTGEDFGDIFGTVQKEDGNASDNADDNLAVDVAALVSTYSFNENSMIEWPVRGNVLLDYSMDSTIYFPTLDSYRCNPAIVIQSENGTSVIAGVSGVVKEVSLNDEIGKYVVVGVGDGYELTYGQLKDITVAAGDVVDAKTVIGSVGEVTRYYKNEGDNVYFEVTKDGTPCDPLDFLK